MIETTVTIPSIKQTTVTLRGVDSLQGDRIVTVDTLDMIIQALDVTPVIIGQDVILSIDTLDLAIAAEDVTPAIAVLIDTLDMQIEPADVTPGIAVSIDTLNMEMQARNVSALVAGQDIAIQIDTLDMQIASLDVTPDIQSDDITVQIGTLDMAIQALDVTPQIIGQDIILPISTLDMQIAAEDVSASIIGQDITVQIDTLDMAIAAEDATGFVGTPSTFTKLVAVDQNDPNFDTAGYTFVDDRGLWEYRPPNFNPANKYPCIIAMHGAGEPGDGGEEDLDLLLNTGMGEVIFNNKALIDEKYPGFVILVPQSFTWSWPESAGSAFLMAAVNRSYIDESKIVLSGLSAGGYGIHALAANATYSPHIRAAFPISTRWPSGLVENMGNALHIPFWYFHGTADNTTQTYAQIKSDIETFNALGPDHLAILTGFIGLGHTEAVWNNVYDHDAQSFDQIVEETYEVLFDQDIVDWLNQYLNDAILIDTLEMVIEVQDVAAVITGGVITVPVASLDMQIQAQNVSTSITGQNITVPIDTLDMVIAAEGVTPDISTPVLLRVLIDFGWTSNQTTEPFQGNNWNNVHADTNNKNLSDPLGPINLVDTQGNASGISFEQTQAGDGNFGAPGNDSGANDAGTNQDVGDYPASACNDSAFVYTGGGGLPAIWVLSGFNDQKDYDVDFWGARGAAAPRGIEISMNSDFSDSQTYEAANNTDYENRASFRISGVTSATFYLRPAPGSTFGYVSVMDIKEVQQ